MKEIMLSTCKLCPKCGCESLEIISGGGYEKEYICVVQCGMRFALNRVNSDKIKIFYNEENELYLWKRFKF